MLEEEFKKAKQIIEDAQSILVLPSPAFQKDTFPAALALFYSLKKLGKNVNLLADDYPSQYKFLMDEAAINPSRADFLIAVKEANTKFTDLFYEKTAEGLKLFLKTNGGQLRKEDITLEPVSSRVPEDLLITVGIEGFNKAEKYLTDREVNVINIDNDPANNNYGEANLIDDTPSSLSEIVFSLLCQFNEGYFDEQTANCLLAGIITATRNFQSPATNSETFQTVSRLTQYAASLKDIKHELYGKPEKGSLAIFAKILNKMEINEGKNLASVLLKTEDFQETGASPSNLKFALRKLTSGLFPFESLLMLWEQKSSPLYVKGVFYSINKEKLEKLFKNFEGKQKGESILFEARESDLEKIKSRILEILS